MNFFQGEDDLKDIGDEQGEVEEWMTREKVKVVDVNQNNEEHLETSDDDEEDEPREVV